MQLLGECDEISQVTQFHGVPPHWELVSVSPSTFIELASSRKRRAGDRPDSSLCERTQCSVRGVGGEIGRMNAGHLDRTGDALRNQGHAHAGGDKSNSDCTSSVRVSIAGTKPPTRQPSER